MVAWLDSFVIVKQSISEIVNVLLNFCTNILEMESTPRSRRKDEPKSASGESVV